MSEGPELSDTEALAAEHALGVLTAPERAAAERRMAADAAFAADVEAWNRRLAPLLDGVAEIAPPARLWLAIARALPANENTAGAARGWRLATFASLGLAAASLAVAVVVANRPPIMVQAPAPQPLVSASLTSPTGGQPLFVASYDPARQALIVTSLVRPGGDPRHIHELWVIPADGKPRALGYIAPGTSKTLPMPAPMLPYLKTGSAIAVSVEPPGGSTRADGPSGPIAAVGKLSRI